MALESAYMCVGRLVCLYVNKSGARHDRACYFRMEMGSNNVVAGQATIYALED